MPIDNNVAWAIHQRALAMAPKQEASTQEPAAWLVYAEDHNGMVPQHPAYENHLHATRCASMFGQTPTEVRPLYDHAAPAVANGALTDAEIHRIAQEYGMYEQHDNARPSGDVVESFSRAILAAAGPDAELVKALEQIMRPYGIYDVAVSNAGGLQLDFIEIGQQARAALSGAKGN